MPDLPKLSDCCDKYVNGEPLTELENFIRLFEPADDIAAYAFRAMLTAALAEAR